MKLQNFTYRKTQLFKAYGTLQIHSHTPPAKREEELKNKTEVCLVQDHTGRQEKTEHRSSGLAIFSLLCKHRSLLPRATQVCLRGTQVLAGRKAEQGRPCGYSWRPQRQRQDSQTCIVCGVSYSNAEVEGEERGRCTEVNSSISLDNIHTLIYILAFLDEHKDMEARMFLLIFSNLSSFPE